MALAGAAQASTVAARSTMVIWSADERRKRAEETFLGEAGQNLPGN